jgi:hypothetical protein
MLPLNRKNKSRVRNIRTAPVKKISIRRGKPTAESCKGAARPRN